MAASRRAGKSPRRAAKKSRKAARSSPARARRAAAGPRNSGRPAPRKAAVRTGRSPAPRAAKARVATLAGLAPNGKPVSSGIGLTHHHMDYSTHDLEGMRRFFVETLGFGNVLHIPEHRYLTVFITPTSSLGFMPPTTSAPEQWQPPGEPSLYFYVEDVDRCHAELSARGVSFELPPTDMPWGHRLTTFRDPEGRRVCLARKLER